MNFSCITNSYDGAFIFATETGFAGEEQQIHIGECPTHLETAPQQTVRGVEEFSGSVLLSTTLVLWQLRPSERRSLHLTLRVSLEGMIHLWNCNKIHVSERVHKQGKQLKLLISGSSSKILLLTCRGVKCLHDMELQESTERFSFKP